MQSLTALCACATSCRRRSRRCTKTQQRRWSLAWRRCWRGGQHEHRVGLLCCALPKRGLLPPTHVALMPTRLVQASAAQQLGALRTVLRLGRRVTAGFGEPAASAGTLQQLPLLQRLVAALDALPPGVDLAGCTVMIGRANGTDALGTIWLEDEGSQEAWAR